MIFLKICYFRGWWNLPSSAGEPKQTIDCIDFIHGTVALSSTDEPFIFFLSTVGKENYCRTTYLYN